MESWTPYDGSTFDVPGVVDREQAVSPERSGADRGWQVGPAPDPVGSNPTVEPSPTGRTGTPERSPVTGSVSGRSYAASQLDVRQFDCLDAIVMHESRWRVDALNRTSGAYGIPQALPASKMASAGADWRTNPVTQVRWMLGYVHGRYGSPCAAWAFWMSHRWY